MHSLTSGGTVFRVMTAMGRLLLLAALTWGCVSAGQSYSNRIAQVAKGEPVYEARGRVNLYPVSAEKF
jgi:hypothetical protein